MSLLVLLRLDEATLLGVRYPNPTTGVRLGERQESSLTFANLRMGEAVEGNV